MPKAVLDAYDDALARREIDTLERMRKIESYLDQGHGACWLRKPEIARVVEENLRHFDGERYRLLAWCIMPNHVHSLIETFDEYCLETVTHGWKSYTAHRVNKILRRRGNVWQAEVFDRYVRGPLHLARTVFYIDENPVAAGLVGRAIEWPYGSARFNEAEDEPS